MEGVNSIITAFEKGIEKSGFKASQVCITSDIIFKPEEIKKLGVDYFHTPRGRAIAFGTGLKLANPVLRVIAVVGDLMTLGGNHFVHGSRRNMDILVVCVNNFIYNKIAGKPLKATSTFSPYSTFEEPFNMPHLGNSCGAVYTSRWTALHEKDLSVSVAEALNKKGVSLIEILAPGINYYDGFDKMDSKTVEFYFKNSKTKNGEDPRNVSITPDDRIIVGKFIEKEKPTFIDNYNMILSKALGDKFTPYGVDNEKSTVKEEK